MERTYEQDEIATPAGASPATAGASSATAGPPIDLERGTLIGRYIVLERVGAGGMGVVFAAYDPPLDRKVALKLLARRGPKLAQAQARLRREAQALAKLGHPNVVAVHDVGEHHTQQGLQLFVAMEFVRGQTLRAWMGEIGAARPWREVLRVLGEAGRGLAAAHDAGLVHRDFKPDNVMLGTDDRVRVMDFGLAREDEDTELDSSFEDVREDTDTPSADTLTQTGSLLGTPAYMAPEQFELGRAGPRADQFSFCVTLYEALYGQRPFAGQTFRDLRESIELGRIREAPRSSKVPAWLRKVVLRGLARAPRNRHDSMQALLEALARDPALRRRRFAAGLGLLATVALGSWGLSARSGSTQPICGDMQRELAGVWDTRARTRGQQAFEATALDFSTRSWTVTQAALDDYSQAWVRARTEACEATQRGTQSDEGLDLRIACLDGRREHLRATVELLIDADTQTLERAPQLVAGLPALERCTDLEMLRARVPPPEDPRLAAAVRELDAQLARSEALELAGHGTEAIALAERALEQATILEHEPARIRAELRVGAIEYEVGQVSRAAELLEHAYGRALALHMHDAAALASMQLVRVNSFERSTWDAASHWARDATSLVEATGDVELQARLLESLGLFAQAKADFHLARVHFAEALTLREGGEGLDRLATAETLSLLAAVTSELGEFDRTHAYIERSLALREELLGSEHPLVADSLYQLGTHAIERNNNEEAQALFQRALDILVRSHGPEHVRLLLALNGLATANLELSHFDQAQASYERALAIATHADRRDHMIAVLDNLGSLHDDRADPQLALDHYTRALALCEEVFGPEHFQCGMTWNNIATAHLDMDHDAVALEAFARAQQIYEATVGPEHPFLANILFNSGLLELNLEMTELGRADLERSLAIYQANELSLDIASVHFIFACHAMDEGHPEQARRQFERAQAQLEAEDEETYDLALLLYSRGYFEYTDRQLTVALTLLERALEMFTRMPERTDDIASTRFYLAQVLWDLPRDQGRDRERARELARSALELVVELGEFSSEDEAEITAWLRARGR